MEYTSQRKLNKYSGERKNLKEIKEMWKDISQRLIFNYKGGKQDCLRICWF